MIMYCSQHDLEHQLLSYANTQGDSGEGLEDRGKCRFNINACETCLGITRNYINHTYLLLISKNDPT